MKPLDLHNLILFSGILRVLLIVYGEWQDSHMEVRYTDVDYFVFSDAADLVSNGKSPFQRSTYRYSPLLAFLLVPNSLLHRSWGKLFFSAADLLVGLFVDGILKLRGVPENLRLWSVAAWLFNPFTFTIGTRGNCEPLVCAIVLWIIICLMNGKVFQAAFWYGLIVHFRVYPIIYALPFVLVLSKSFDGSSRESSLQQWDPMQNKPFRSSDVKVARLSLWSLLRSCVKERVLLFGLFSASMFFFWTALFFSLYGWDFLNEALLYHLTRTDPRHNFSIYFYHIYLHHQQGFSVLEKLISFLPQMMVQLALVFCFFEDLSFCLFAQTVAFVAFNKVITAQYFVWFFCLLPLILPWSSMKLRWNGIFCILVWMGSQMHWLWWAYLLEFKGRNVFVQLWLASLVFLAANTWVLLKIIRHHRFMPFFKPFAGSHSRSSDARKLE